MTVRVHQSSNNNNNNETIQWRKGGWKPVVSAPSLFNLEEGTVSIILSFLGPGEEEELNDGKVEGGSIQAGLGVHYRSLP